MTLAKKEKQPMSWKVKENIFSFTYLAPFLVLFALFTILPIIIAIILSFTNYNIFQFPDLIGFDNYMELFFGDDEFLIALKNTLVIAVISGPAGYLASLCVAWFINDLNPKIRPVMVLLFYAPSISGGAFMIWQLMFSGDAYGYANSLLMYFGIIEEPIQWLTDTNYMLPLVIAVQIWMSLGVSFLSMIAGLQGIDRQLFEAAAVDGVKNRWQELFYVTLPSMGPQLLFAAVMQISSAFSVSSICMTLAGFPSTDNAALTVVTHIYDYGNIRFEMGYACAISVVLFIFIMKLNDFIQSFITKHTAV